MFDNKIFDTVAGTLTANVAAAGSDTQIQFNDGGSFAGASGLLYDKTNIGLTLSRVADDALGPAFVFQQSRGAAGQVGDVLGAISFKGYNDNATPALKTFVSMTASISDASDTTEDGAFALSVIGAGTAYDAFKVSSALGYSNVNFDGTGIGTNVTICGTGPVNSGGTLNINTNGGNASLHWTSALTAKYRIFYGGNWNVLILYDDTGGGGYIWAVYDGNFVITPNGEHPTLGTSAKNILGIGQGTAPTTVATDFVQMWCADYAAGDARLSIMGEKNTNTLTLGAGNVLLRPDTMADDSVSGETFVGTAGEDLAWGDVVYMAADGKFYKADADSSSTAPAVAFCTATISADASGEFLKRGWIRDDSAYNFTKGPGASGLIYLSTDAGAVTQTAPSGTGDQVQVLGWAYTADIWYFEPQLVVVEV